MADQVRAVPAVIDAAAPRTAATLVFPGDKRLLWNGPCVKAPRIRIARADSELGERIGRVVDLVLDDRGWAVRHLTVALNDEGGDRTVAVEVGWVSGVSADAQAVVLALPSEQVRHAPPHDRASVLGPDDAPRAARDRRPPSAVDR